MFIYQSGGTGFGMPQQALSLTADQKAGLSEVLLNYDAGSLTDDDAASLVGEVQELGIQPGRTLADALSEAGFDAKGIAEQAGLEKPPPPPPPGGRSDSSAKGPDSSAVETLRSIVEQFSDAEDGSGTTLNEALTEAGLDLTTPIVDFRV